MAQFSRWNELAVCILPLSLAGAAQEKKELTAGELTENETPAKAIRRGPIGGLVCLAGRRARAERTWQPVRAQALSLPYCSAH